MTNPDPHPADVYAAAYDTYRQAGWTSPLPLPPKKKHPVPTGWTGNDGATPSYADLYAWAEERPNANIALRLPETVIGIDVDAYGDKGGGTTLQLLEQTWGTLPATWRTTSRDDGISGIRLYRAPAGLRWPSVAGASIEIIRHAHRYAIVWPSIHPEGGTYRWINPHGATTIGEVPTPDDLPLLPAAWVDGLTGGRQAGERQRADLTDHQATTWLAERPAGQPCPAVARVLQKRTADLTTPGTTRHDAMLEATQRLAYLAAEGHQGVPTALHTLEQVFLQLVTRDGTRDPREAELEWDRAVTGAVRNAAVTTLNDGDPCTNPYASLAQQAPTSPADLVREAARKDTETWSNSHSTSSTATAPAATPTTTTSPGATAPADGASLDAALAGETASPSDAPDDPPPSWRPIDLTPYLDGTWTPDQPTLLHRTDGQALLYPGKVHDFHGESESGKSLVAQAAAAAEIQAGNPVLYVDFEDDAGPVTRRLLAMGATPAQLQAHFTYIRPETSPYALTEAAEWAQLLDRQFVLAVLDGVTDALVQFGAGTKENDDITSWHRAVPRMLARRTGAAVLLVDHVIKNTETRGRFAIGGQAKMAALDGASYTVEVTQPIGKGMAGTITLRIGKDRPGEIRAHCGAWRATDRSQEAAAITIDSTGDHGPGIHVHIGPPTTSVTDRTGDDGPFKPTAVMEKISRLLEATREPLSFRQLEQAYRDDGGKAKRQTFADAVNLLADGKHIAEEPGPRNARMFRSANVYRQRTDPESDAFEAPIDLPERPSPDRPPTVPRDGETTVPHHRPPVGAVGTVTVAQNTDRPPANQGDTPDRPTGPGWQLDYLTGEYINRDTGEVWDGGDQ